MAETRVVELRKQGLDVVIYAVGKKAQSYFRYRNYRIEQTWLGITDTPGYGDARAIGRTIMAAYGHERIDAVEAFFTRYQSALTQVPTQAEILPISPPEMGEDEKAAAAAVSYEFEPSPDEILARLLPMYVEAIVFNMLLEASASEHSARRRAMKAATDNAEELIRALRVQANRARQAEITTAITEIVGGAEALVGSDK